MLEVSPQTPDNLPPLDIAREMAAVIRRWRSEISVTKDLGVMIDAQPLADFLQKVDDRGLPATLVAFTVLYCEWSFRVRRITEDDIKRALSDLVEHLSWPPSGPLSLSEAQLLVSAIEPNLRRQMKGMRIPSIYGVDGNTGVLDSRAPRIFTPLIETRRGSLPLMGPVVAGLVTETLWEKHAQESGAAIGRELCAILLNRAVVRIEYAKWKQNAGAFQVSERDPPGLAQWLAGPIYATYQRNTKENAMTAGTLLEQCAEDPRVVLGECAAPTVVRMVYTLPWNAGKTKRIA